MDRDSFLQIILFVQSRVINCRSLDALRPCYWLIRLLQRETERYIYM